MILSVADLKKSYFTPDGQIHQVVHVPHFTIEEKEQIALHGTSGCGKTTFLNLVAGILQADGGRVSVGGDEMASSSEFDRDRIRAANIGYVFQTFNLLQGYTALENVLLAMMFGRGVDPIFAKKLLDRVGLLNRMNYHPRQLSVGQQQRVAVARALANRPKLVLADEPTGNLDSSNAKEVLKLIREICSENKAALLVVSHDYDVLQQFGKIIEFSSLNQATAPKADVSVLL